MRTADVRARFATALKSLRSERKISQEELAGRAGLHRTYVADIERAARNPSLESIEKLARAFELPLASLFCHPSEMLVTKPSSLKDYPSIDFVDILLIESRTEDVEIAVSALKEAGVANSFHLLRDGAAALNYFFGHGNHSRRRSRSQLILLSLNLPKVQGLEILRRLKADLKTREIPVVILTVSEKSPEIPECRRLGAESFILKPMSFQSLIRLTPQLGLAWALLRLGSSHRS